MSKKPAKRGPALARKKTPTRPTRKKKPNPQDATLRNVRAANRKIHELFASLSTLAADLADIKHQVGHLVVRVTDLDGQVGGGDEMTSRPETDPSYTGDR